jgi:hypothetical protein
MAEDIYNPRMTGLFALYNVAITPHGSLVIISSSSDPQASFVADVTGTYNIKIIVNTMVWFQKKGGKR